MEKTTRFSGADWASEKREIMVIGQGGIGSWLSLNLSRVGHNLILIDDDRVDETNVTGGQMFGKHHINNSKVGSVKDMCRVFGCDNTIDVITEKYSKKLGTTRIMITGLDNMKGRRETFEAWRESLGYENTDSCLFIDGRLTMEMWEIFAIKGNDKKSIEEFEKNHLFTDEEAVLLDCSTKQSTFSAMSIAGAITSTVCNFLTNLKLKEEMRTVPFYQRMYFPINLYEITLPPQVKEEGIIETDKIALVNE